MPEHVGFIARRFGESVSRAPHGFWDVGILGLTTVLAMKALLDSFNPTPEPRLFIFCQP